MDPVDFSVMYSVSSLMIRQKIVKKENTISRQDNGERQVEQTSLLLMQLVLI